MTDLLHLAESWREKAARIRERYLGFGPMGDAANSAATALETCADEVEAEMKKRAAKKDELLQ